jgi:hypothetical protein
MSGLSESYLVGYASIADNDSIAGTLDMIGAPAILLQAKLWRFWCAQWQNWGRVCYYVLRYTYTAKSFRAAPMYRNVPEVEAMRSKYYSVSASES